MGDIHEAHNKVEEAVVAIKQVEANVLRNLSSLQDDISDREARLSESVEEYKKEKKTWEAEKTVLEQLIANNIKMVPKEVNNTLNMVRNNTSLEEITLNIRTENAMVGDGNKQINVGAPTKLINSIDSKVSELVTQVRDGKMDKDELNQTLKGMQKELSSDVESLRKTIDENNKKLADQMEKIKDQTITIERLIREKIKLNSDLQKEKERKRTIELQEVSIYNQIPLPELQSEEKTEEESKPSGNHYAQIWNDMYLKALEESENEKRSLNEELVKLGKNLQEVKKENCKLVKQVHTSSRSSRITQEHVSILKFMENEHESLKLEFIDISEERKIQERDLQLSLKQSMQNETFLKNENQCLELRAENAKQDLLRSNSACDEAKIKISKLQTAVEVETRAAFAAKTKLSNIVSRLQQLTGLKHGKEGQEWSIDEELVRTHLEEYIENEKRKITNFEKSMKIKDEFIAEQKKTMSEHEKNMKQSREAHEKSRKEYNNIQLENIDLIQTLKVQLQQSKENIRSVTRKLEISERDHVTSKNEIKDNKEQIKMYRQKIEESNRKIRKYEQQISQSQVQQDGSRHQFGSQKTELRGANRGLYDAFSADLPTTRLMQFRSLQKEEKKKTGQHTDNQDTIKEDI